MAKKGISKKQIYTQLWKEFKIAFWVAIIWTFLMGMFFHEKDTNQIKDIISFIFPFFTSFAFVGYFTGQYTRVSKQLKVEANFENSENKLIHLTEDLKSKTDHLINYMTGGDSYFYYKMGINITPDKFFKLEPIYVGEYPLNNIKIWFPSKNSNFKEHSFNIQNINNNLLFRANCEMKIDFNDNKYTTSIIYTADNKNWVQMFYFTLNGLEIKVETAIYTSQNKISEEAYVTELLDWNNGMVEH